MKITAENIKDLKIEDILYFVTAENRVEKRVYCGKIWENYIFLDLMLYRVVKIPNDKHIEHDMYLFIGIFTDEKEANIRLKEFLVSKINVINEKFGI